MKKIKWELTPECNLNCKHCGAYANEKKQILPLEENKKILHKLVQNGLQQIVLITKEPTMYDNWLEFIEYCSFIGVNVVLITNGTLLNESILRRLYKCRIDLLSISLEGISASTNDCIRGNSTFSKVMEVFELVQNLNKEYVTCFPLGVQLNLNACNLKECEEIIEFFEKLPITNLSIGRLAVAGNMKENIFLKPKYEDEIVACEKIISSYLDNEKIRFKLLFKLFSVYEAIYFNFKYDIDLYAFPPKCGAIDGTYSIMSDSTLCSCNLLKGENIVSNDLLDIGTVNDLYDLDNYIEKNKSKYLEYKEEGICKSCRFNQDCEICILVSQNTVEMLEQRRICEMYIYKISGVVEGILDGTIKIGFSDSIVFWEKENSITLYSSFNNSVSIYDKVEISFVKSLYFDNEYIVIDKKLQKKVVETLLYNNMLREKEGAYE
ncbi:MAG: radical SAM protein [Lachnospiraceae bacterium]|nr:radical SAM protein [Lachnospiraceae bacterium]